MDIRTDHTIHLDLAAGEAEALAAEISEALNTRTGLALLRELREELIRLSQPRYPQPVYPPVPPLAPPQYPQPPYPFRYPPPVPPSWMGGPSPVPQAYPPFQPYPGPTAGEPGPGEPPMAADGT